MTNGCDLRGKKPQNENEPDAVSNSLSVTQLTTISPEIVEKAKQLDEAECEDSVYQKYWTDIVVPHINNLYLLKLEHDNRILELKNSLVSDIIKSTKNLK